MSLTQLLTVTAPFSSVMATFEHHRLYPNTLLVPDEGIGEMRCFENLMAALYPFMKAVFEPENMMDLHLVYSDIEHLMVLFFPGDMHMMGLVWVNYLADLHLME